MNGKLVSPPTEPIDEMLLSSVNNQTHDYPQPANQCGLTAAPYQNHP